MTEKGKIIWTAGLLEGEGCFRVRRPEKHNVVITASMTDKDVVFRLKDIWGGSIYRRDNDDKENWQTAYRWNLYNQKDCFDLCKKILPYMGKRRSRKIEKLIAERMAAEKEKEIRRSKRKDRNKQIKERYENQDVSYGEIAKDYDLTPSGIGRIVRS